jgi:hypothetical protein
MFEGLPGARMQFLAMSSPPMKQQVWNNVVCSESSYFNTFVLFGVQQS